MELPTGLVEKPVYAQGYAYARNGNAHNPTPRVCFVVFIDDARRGDEPKLRGAKELAGELLAA